MNKNQLYAILFLAVCALVFFLFYQLILPFFVPIAWGTVFALLLAPLYQRLSLKFKSQTLASLTVCLITLIILVGPIGYLFVATVSEAFDLVNYLNALHDKGALSSLYNMNVPWLTTLKDFIAPYFNVSSLNLEDLIVEGVKKLSSLLVDQTSSLIANLAKAVFYFTLMLFSLFYFLRDGHLLAKKIKGVLPMAQKEVDQTFDQLKEITIVTVKSSVLVAALQGLVGGILFALVGLPSPIFWGCMMGFLSVIPFIGAFLVYIPAGLILIATGSVAKGAIVLSVGALVISQIDNFLRPFLLADKTSMHPLLVFFSVMGGIAMFGLLGIVIGPLIAALFLTVINVVELTLQSASD